MPEITENTMLRGWARECGKGFPYPSPDLFCRRGVLFDEERWRQQLVRNNHIPVEGGEPRQPDEKAIDILLGQRRRQFRKENPWFTIRTTEEGAITVQQEGGRNRPVIEMARYIGKRFEKRSIALMNGDGFENRSLQGIQAAIRGVIQDEFTRNEQRMIVPYAALESAGLVLSSLVPIHIAGDRRVQMVAKVAKVPQSVIDRERLKLTAASPRVSFEHNERSYRLNWNYNYKPGISGQYGTENPAIEVVHTPEFSNQQAMYRISAPANGDWTVTEEVHRLGSAVFWAVGPDGQRHRWISSFDQNENPPMYFLAQLPDRGGIRYVTHAIRLLAPKIVQKAREDGRRVFRQGDIFTIETDMKDEDFSPDQITRRHHVFSYQNPPNVFSGGTSGTTWTTMALDVNMTSSTVSTAEGAWMLAVAPPLVVEPGNQRWYLEQRARLSKKLRDGLMIYRTGHTASMVAVTSYGTFVKGTMYHDPILENIRAGRAPEHAPLQLGDGQKWYLAVRNAVPRLSTADSVVSGDDNTRGTVLEESPENEPVLVVDRSNNGRIRRPATRAARGRTNQSSPALVGDS